MTQRYLWEHFPGAGWEQLYAEDYLLWLRNAGNEEEEKEDGKVQ